ncbi:MAG TPA: hypothetical protein VHD32_13235 [Candidatus Didemnitutus sp.]|nr:hypothetical protein [Candidatus Didemnitutus sp.]
MTPAQVIPALIIPLLIWRVYRRFRRNVGRQHFHPGRLTTTIVIFSLFTAAIAFYAWPNQDALLALGGGLAGAVILSLIGLHLTTFEKTPEDVFYTPNTVIGVTITLLFVARICYRVITFTAPAPGQYVPPVFQSPLTLGVYGLTIGYYIAYCSAVLIRGKKLAASAQA